MTIISVDRYICILKTDWKKITPIVAICSIIILWILGFIAFIPLAMYFDVKSFAFGNTEITLCTLMWPYYHTVRLSMIFTVSVSIIGFVIPLTILALSYFRILRKFWKTRHAVGSAMKSIKFREERDFRLIKNLILMVVLFLVMWLPIFVVMALIQANGMEDNMEIPSYALIIAVCVALGNACVNPFLYGIVNGRMKRGILRSVLSQNKKLRISTIDSKTENSRIGNSGPK
jgi:hypothetical protein